MKPRVAVLIAALLSSAHTLSAGWTAGPYVYDGAGNIVSIGTDAFTYDAFGRVTTASVAGQPQQFAYDRFGNIRTITTGTTTITLGVNPSSNRLSRSTDATTGQPVNAWATYDAAGRLKQWQTSAGSYAYDAFGMMTSSSSPDEIYLYTPSDERIATIHMANGAETSSEWTLRDASGKVLRRLEKSPGGWRWRQDYIYLNGQLLAAEVDNSAKTLHFFPDHLGTPRLITGNGGVEIARHTYFPFGAEITPANQDTERLKFTGHERDVSGPDYMHARYYSSGVGRFLSADPSSRSVDPARPQTWNRYSYCYDNPLRYIDPDGEAPTSINFKLGRFSFHLDWTHSSRVPAPHFDVKEGKIKLGRFQIDKWASEADSKIPKSAVKLLEEAAENGRLPGTAMRALAEYAPQALKVAGRAALVVGVILSIVDADDLNASENVSLQALNATTQKLFEKDFEELTPEELEQLWQHARAEQDRAAEQK